MAQGKTIIAAEQLSALICDMGPLCACTLCIHVCINVQQYENSDPCMFMRNMYPLVEEEANLLLSPV